ncbi:hypothetical protein FDECE_1274 [Fusarium decemcellulare]|nr:hypothetical protein FDECE_1274 [Fusarium decemcellulare]
MLAIVLLGLSVFKATAWSTPGQGCGKVNVFYTGLPAYHPVSRASGIDPAELDAGLRNGTEAMIKAGYNVRMVLAGPEQDISRLKSRMDGIDWQVTGIGYGVRASKTHEMIIRFEDLIKLFNTIPNAPIVFNYGAEDLVWSVQHRLPILGNCTEHSGELLGYEEFCDEICDH